MCPPLASALYALVEKEEVDHEDHNGLNNRRNNLRSSPGLGNKQNRRKPRTGTTSNYKSVCLSKGKFAASIEVQSKNTHLGYFESEVEAAQAYDAAARKHFGKFAAVNFPQPGEQTAIRGIDDTPEGEEP
jgi:hypothetical protein